MISRSGAAPGQPLEVASPVAITLLVLVIGAGAYLWWRGYLRGKAALVTMVVVTVVLIYIGFFSDRPPT